MPESRTIKRSFWIIFAAAAVLNASQIFPQTEIIENGTGKKIEYVEHEAFRTLAVIPLANETGEERVDYLRTGILKMIRSELEKIYQVVVDDPEVRFIARPYPHKKNRKSYRKGKSRLPLRIRLIQLNSDMEDLFYMTDSVKQAESLNADYILSGNFSGDSVGILVLNFTLFDARRMKTKTFQYEVHVQNIYSNLGPIAEKIAGEFSSYEFANLTVRTPVDGAMVYLDDHYLGKTPVNKKVFPDRYTLYVEQDGYETYSEEVNLPVGAVKAVTVNSKKKIHKGILSVTSEPSGSDVYLNITKIGTTPLIRDDLPEGTHRVRISKDGYIDRFIGVKLSGKKSTSFNVRMKEGDTFRHFRDPHYVVLDWTYDDLSFSTMISSLFFYAGYWSYRANADRILDSMNLEYLQLLAVFNQPELTLIEYFRLEAEAKKAAASVRKANISAGGGVFMLLLSGALLWRGLFLETKETGEVLNKKDYSFYIAPDFNPEQNLKVSGMDLGLRIRF
ncbi:MAG: PEGA domain-containing protein [Spirochaetia bacterium]|nr:PEGA domain-containing protein [Spirochaetia bacterium]